MELGPKNRELLKLQVIHRSQVVWDTQPTEVIHIRRGDTPFWKQYVPPACHGHIASAGFLAVYFAGHVELDHGLITALVERWRPETHTFHLPVGECTITLQDIAILWGLRIHGRAVTGMEEPRSTTSWISICHQLMGFQPHANDIKGGRLNRKALTDWLTANPLAEDATAHEILQRSRALTFLLLAGLLGDMSHTRMKLGYLSLLENMDKAGQYSWGSAILAHVYRCLCDASRCDKADLCGPMSLVQLWAWERIPTIRPGRPVFQPYIGAPRGVWWKNLSSVKKVGSNTLTVYRDQLDRLREGDFIWTPYSPELMAALPQFCTIDHVQWRADVPLICFEIVEHHFPQRVMRQFGMMQKIPDPVDTSISLHHIERRAANTDYAVIHHNWVERWDRRLHHIVDGEVSTEPVGYHSSYMKWYRDRTILFLTRPKSAAGIEGFVGNASTLHYLANTMSRIYFMAVDHEDETISHLAAMSLSEVGLSYLIAKRPDDMPPQHEKDGTPPLIFQSST